MCINLTSNNCLVTNKYSIRTDLIFTYKRRKDLFIHYNFNLFFYFYKYTNKIKPFKNTHTWNRSILDVANLYYNSQN